MEKRVNKPLIPQKKPPSERKKLSLSYLAEKRDMSIKNSYKDDSLAQKSMSYVDLDIRTLSLLDKVDSKRNSAQDDILKQDESTSFLNESHYFITEEQIGEDDANSHVYCFLSETTNSIIIEEPRNSKSLSTKSIPRLPQKRSKFVTSTLKTQESQATMKEYTLETFKQAIFQRDENQLCCDCQCQEEQVRWISCLYLITMCDLCAEIHRKLPHKQNKYYLIEIDELYQQLIRNEIDGIDCFTFLNILSQTGNEKFNSLIEAQIDNARRDSGVDVHNININNNEKLEVFIRNKYLNKCLTVSDFGLDFKSNYINEINQEILKIIKTPSLSITIFFIYLGANLNHTDPFTNKTLLDIALDFNQTLQYSYLKLNKAVSFFNLNDHQLLDYQFNGCLNQVYDLTRINKCEATVKIHKNHLYLSTYNQLINFSSLIRVFAINNKINLIEFKWLNTINNSLISSYFEYKSHQERQIWMKELCYKMMLNLSNRIRLLNSNFINLINIIETLQIKSVGYLDLVNQSNSHSDKCLVILLQSLPIQVSFDKKYLALVKSNDEDNSFYSHDLIDLKLLTNIKKTEETLELSLSGSKKYVLKSIGYTLNLKSWYDQLDSMVHLSSISNKFKPNISQKDIKIF